ncbi:DUF3558 domain-containing protein [Amycolatopsis acidicola]|uniref:DUF3558 domain-containing protein n=1 Tax=Amycolatopsis acidicola TaxID=2596893 RepID=A0A5N0V795_9PSEU|nr:DUF3558 domain-containing protein [Amycolatopsis acidicola]KAA9161073.1 DUF3558 domain-containing protein [Amycolatopsis acidicola]
MAAKAEAAAAGLLAMITLGGCTTSVAGVADPPSSASAVPRLAARTKDLSLQGVDPCTLLTAPQLTELKENGAPRQAPQRDGPTCAFDVDATAPSYTYYLETVTTADIEDWLSGGHHKTSMTQQPVSVPGFPALVNFAPSNGIQDCEALVGVAPGQTLRAETAPDDSSFSQQQLCDMATNVAKMAVQTLETLR